MGETAKAARELSLWRQGRVKDLLAEGKTAREIARQLNVHHNSVYRLAHRVGISFVRPTKSEPSTLTPRERDVAERVADGLEMKEIGRELGLGYQTVKTHIRHVKGKMGVRNQIELALTMRGHTPRCLRSA